MYHFYLGGKRIMRKTEDIKLLIQGAYSGGKITIMRLVYNYPN